MNLRTCPKCGRRYQVKPEFAGRTLRCRNCGAGVPDPALQLAVAGAPSNRETLSFAAGLPGTDPEINPAAVVATTSRRRRSQRAVLLLAVAVVIVVALAFIFANSKKGIFNLEGITQAEPPKFDPNDWAKTLKWAEGIEKRRDNLARQNNHIRLGKFTDEVRNDINPWIGKEIKWDLQVTGVGASSVWLQKHEGFLNLILTPDNMKLGDRGGYDVQGSLVIGKHVSLEEAEPLRKGSRITIIGRIDNVTLDAGISQGLWFEINQVRSANFKK